jgi:16S rRNA (cytosine1402-N4)-methyltransferase
MYFLIDNNYIESPKKLQLKTHFPIMYHIPVMLAECIEGLDLKPDGVYVDLTFGGGGHSKAILEKLDGGKLYAFDQDEEAEQNAKALNFNGFTFIKANFRHLKKYLKLHGCTAVDGILADLGVSSHQIDSAVRGFSTRFDGELDMRMGKTQDLSAKQVLNKYSKDELHRIFGMYGEVRNAKTLAEGIIQVRNSKPINTTQELKAILNRFAPKHQEFRYHAQVFQALRIEVNNELEALEEMLPQTAEILKPDGRLVVLTYHSLEDRLVKNFIQKGKFHGEIDKDIYGNYSLPLAALNKKPIEASATEIAQNNRARSAKLRVAVKTKSV